MQFEDFWHVLQVDIEAKPVIRKLNIDIFFLPKNIVDFFMVKFVTHT